MAREFPPDVMTQTPHMLPTPVLAPAAVGSSTHAGTPPRINNHSTEANSK